jgi:glycosyltransferase involved in cell wall biosynthesis
VRLDRGRPPASRPLVSVVTTAYEPDPGHLEQAYDSLLRQSVPWEWLVQVDGEGDMPLLLRRDGRVSIDRNEGRLGVAVSRNRALVRARGEFVQALDADDAILGDGLDVLGRELAAAGDAAFAFGGVARLLPSGAIETRPYPWFAPGRVRAGHLESVWRAQGVVPVAGGAVMWRRRLLFAYGGWAALSGSEDTAPLLAAAAVHDSIYVGADVLLQRIHDRQLSASREYERARSTNWAFIGERARAVRTLGR